MAEKTYDVEIVTKEMPVHYVKTAFGEFSANQVMNYLEALEGTDANMNAAIPNNRDLQAWLVDIGVVRTNAHGGCYENLGRQELLDFLCKKVFA